MLGSVDYNRDYNIGKDHGQFSMESAQHSYNCMVIADEFLIH